jgi:hypothetical protein
MSRKANAPLSQPVFGEPVFNEGVATPDPTTFRTPHPSDEKTYQQIQSLLTKDTVTFKASRGKPGDLYTLAAALGSHGAGDTASIQTAGQIVFHAAGDTGASNIKKFGNELSVADQVTNDFHSSVEADRPAFFLHLGDIVYDFCESQYWYDQFYEPFRDYPAPIFAIPGNHDSFIVPNTKPADYPLAIFTRNFCNLNRVLTKEAASLHRTAMNQPGVYFTLDAPFVRIIGLFSNALEDPGMISSQKGQKATWPGVPDLQLAYLTAQLQNIKAQKYAGAVLLAVHHPPFSYDPPPAAKGGAGGSHSSSTPMLADIDNICKQVGVYPHAFLSGHAHNYQHYTRKVTVAMNNYSVPFLVCGNGGHNVTGLVQASKGVLPPDPKPGADVSYLDVNPVIKTSGLTLNRFDHANSGYLRITVNSKQLKIEFHPVGKHVTPADIDTTTVDLATHTVV